VHRTLEGFEAFLHLNHNAITRRNPEPDQGIGILGRAGEHIGIGRDVPAARLKEAGRCIGWKS